MKHFKFTCLFFLILGYTFSLDAQTVKKRTIVEHFTNTRCSVCASMNPGFYKALGQNPDVIHIAYHPSAPYSNCLFSTQNKIQNDARTNFYNIYGTTPRFIINGEERTSTQVQSAQVYDDFKNQTSPIDLKVKVAKLGTDQIEVSFDAKALSNNSVGSVSYFIALVEDTVFYNAPNGENIHHDVFRKSFTNAGIPAFTLPQFEGNVITLTDSRKIESLWDARRIYAVVVLTDTNKKVIQVAKSALFNPGVSSSEDELNTDKSVSIYPNPVSSELFFKTINEKVNKVVIKNGNGQNVMEVNPHQHQSSVEIGHLVSGAYFLELSFDKKTSVQKFIKL